MIQYDTNLYADIMYLAHERKIHFNLFESSVPLSNKILDCSLDITVPKNTTKDVIFVWFELFLHSFYYCNMPDYLEGRRSLCPSNQKLTITHLYITDYNGHSILNKQVARFKQKEMMFYLYPEATDKEKSEMLEILNQEKTIFPDDVDAQVMFFVKTLNKEKEEDSFYLPFGE